jgi:hypothetical protein
VLQKMKAAGYNVNYFDWGYQSPKPGVYGFTGVRDVEQLLDIADEVGIYVIARPGPYINADRQRRLPRLADHAEAPRALERAGLHGGLPRLAFGPANATGGAWECPDLFSLAVDGDPRHAKWVLIVNLNRGGIAGGSAAQYFVGTFDGTRSTADNAGPYTPRAGDVMADFESADDGGWTATGTAFGSGPAHGTLPGQQPASSTSTTHREH